jgi:hypothetical protein
MLRRLAPLALVALAAFAIPRVSAAQDLATPTTEPTVAAPVAPAGPTLDGATVALKRAPSEQQVTKAPVVMASARGNDRGTVLMIVGGAAFVAGVLMDNDVGPLFEVGGAAIGLYGLYLYLQ